MNATRALWLSLVLLSACAGPGEERVGQMDSSSGAESTDGEADTSEPSTEPPEAEAEAHEGVECESNVDCGEGELCAPCCGRNACVPETALGCLCGGG